MSKVIIMVGAPGSGKSTYAKRLFAQHQEEQGDNPFKFARICSADNFFTDREGVYTFDPKKIGEAHKQCLRGFLSVIASDHNDLIILDNTNTTILEMAPYISIAKAYDREVELVEMVVQPEDFEKVAARNVHGVPKKSVERMLENIQRLRLPPYWNKESGVSYRKVPVEF